MLDESISDLDGLLHAAQTLLPAAEQRLWYRGAADRTWELQPSSHRTPPRTANERRATNDFYIRARQVMDAPPPKTDYARWIALMQHYSLPTRMLDWSRSLLVATYFAVEDCASRPGLDACVWVLDPYVLNERQGFGAWIYPEDSNTAQEMLVGAFKSPPPDPHVDDKILACYAVENDLRMYSQQAAFTIHNTAAKLQDVCEDDCLCCLIIPDSRRAYFLEALSVFGITEGFIYPDLDHIAREIRNRHNLA